MLYVSTRNRTDSFTSYRALHEERAPDGGLFVPFRLPAFSKDEVRALQNKSFDECIAQILNLFFAAGLTGLDIERLIGSAPIRINMMPHRLIICELWRNIEFTYASLERALYQKISRTAEKKPTDWFKIAVRVAVLFGVFAELARNGIREADIAVTVGDFSVPMAVYYAKTMGLPIGTVICGCNENSSTWDLIHHGEINTGTAVVHTELPALDYACPESIERLIYSTLGLVEVQRYVDTCSNGAVYNLSDENISAVLDGFASAVVSGRRTRSVIVSTYRTSGYIMDGYTAVTYGALQDYRASTGESRTTILLSDNSPVSFESEISKLLDMKRDELRKKL